jgi:hypothetical protein
MPRKLPELLIHSRHRLGIASQGELGELLGSSRRSGQRWERSEATPSPAQIAQLAALVHPRDAALAAELAQHAGKTLVELGVEAPPPPEPPPAPPGPPPPALPDPVHCVDTVVCAAAEAMKVMPDEIRPALRAAFRRARLARLSVELIDTGLSGPLPEEATAAAPEAPKGRASKR